MPMNDHDHSHSSFVPGTHSFQELKGSYSKGALKAAREIFKTVIKYTFNQCKDTKVSVI